MFNFKRLSALIAVILIITASLFGIVTARKANAAGPVYRTFPQYWDHNALIVSFGSGMTDAWINQSRQAMNKWNSVGTAVSLQESSTKPIDITIFAEPSIGGTICGDPNTVTDALACTNDGAGLLGSTTAAKLSNVKIQLFPIIW